MSTYEILVPPGDKPGDGAREKAGGRRAVITGQHFGVGEARTVVDGDVHMLPADVPRAAAAIAVYAMADASDPPQLLDVEMHERARSAMLITQHRSRRLEPTQAIEPQAALNSDDRRYGMAVILRDAERAPTSAPAAFNLPALVARQLPR